MKLLTKAALGALMLAGATALTAAPAEAHVSIGIGIGGGYYPGYDGPPAYCDRYSRFYNPYRCDAYDDYDYYDGPVFIDGVWLNDSFRSRWYGGHRQFFYHGGWHGGSGWHSGGFRHGGGHGGGGWSHGGGHSGGGWSHGGGHSGGGHHHH
jgi:hypothetical protein